MILNIEGPRFQKLVRTYIGLTPTFFAIFYIVLKPFKFVNLFPLIYSMVALVTLMMISIIPKKYQNQNNSWVLFNVALAFFELIYLNILDDNYIFQTLTISYTIMSIICVMKYWNAINLIITSIFYTFLFVAYGPNHTSALNNLIEFSLLLIIVINAIQIVHMVRFKKGKLIQQIRPYQAMFIQLSLLAVILLISNKIDKDLFFLFSMAFYFNISRSSEKNQNVGDFIHPILNKSYSQNSFITQIVPLSLVYLLIILFYVEMLIIEKSIFNPIVFIFIYFILLIIQGIQYTFSISLSSFVLKPRVSIIGPFDYLAELAPIRSNHYFTLYVSNDIPMFRNTIDVILSGKPIDLYYELSRSTSNVIIMRGEQNFLNAKLSKTPFLLAFSNSEIVLDEFQRKSPLNVLNNNIGNYTGVQGEGIKASNEIIDNLKVLECLKLNEIILSKHSFQDSKIYHNIPFDVAYLHQRIISTADKQLRTLANLNFIEMTLRYIYFIRSAIGNLCLEVSPKLSFGYIVSCCENNPILNLESHRVIISNYTIARRCLIDIGWNAKFGEKMNMVELLKVANYVRNKVLGHGSVGTVSEELLYFTEFISLKVLELCSVYCKDVYLYEEEKDYCQIYAGCSSRRIRKIYHNIVRYNRMFYDSDFLKFHEGYLYVYDGMSNNGKREFINYTNGKRIRPDVILL